MSAPPIPPELPSAQPAPSGQWAYPANEQGEPKQKFVLWIVFGAAGCFVAIVGLGILATLVIPKVARSLGSAQRAKAQEDVEYLCAWLQAYAHEHGEQYPESLDALMHPGGPELPRDPWGRAYYYRPPSTERNVPDVYSLGRDGLPGGSGADEDVHPIQLQPRKR